MMEITGIKWIHHINASCGRWLEGRINCIGIKHPLNSRTEGLGLC